MLFFNEDGFCKDRFVFDAFHLIMNCSTCFVLSASCHFFTASCMKYIIDC